MRKFLNRQTLVNVIYILLIVTSFLLVPYHNIRTGYTSWGVTGFIGIKGPVNAGALAVQRALTFALIVFFIYTLRMRRKIRFENLEVDMAIRESEDRRHRVEREYFKLRRQTQNIFDTMEDFVVICSRDYKIEFMNKSSRRVFGEGRGKTCHQILFREGKPCQWCHSDRVFNGESVNWEHRHRINNRIYRIHNSPFINPDGSVSLITIFHDITKERVAEEKLDSSEKYFRTLFEHLPAACFGYDQEGIIVAWNAAAVELYGYQKSDIIGRSIFDTLCQENDYERTLCYIRQVFEGKSFEGLEWEDRAADGSLRYVYSATYPMRNLEGKIVMGISANIDITTRRLMENELRDSKEHLEKIMETPNTLIVELDPEMNIRRFNRGCEEVTGYTRQEVLGKKWIATFIPERLQDTIQVVLDEVKKESSLVPKQMENPILSKGGEERVIFWSNTSLKDEHGEVISIIAMGKDITERKKVQRKIVEAESRYRMFLDNVPIHVGAVDDTGKFILWNKFSEQLLGYTKEEAIGNLTPSVIHETAEEAKEVVMIAAREGIFDRELNFIHKNGTKIPVRLVVVPMRAYDSIVGFYGFAESIARQRTTEQELLEAPSQLEGVALKDHLTGLYNRRYVSERLDFEFERVKRAFSSLSILLIDIDYFKSINDSYGHDFGNTILVQIAKFFKSELRSNDIIARWGGEEFMIILPDVGRESAISIAKKIHRVFKAKGFGDSGHVVNLTSSIGIVSYPEDPLFNPEEMFHAVEKSMLKVKGVGGDGIGSYVYGRIKEDGSNIIAEKDRLIESIKGKLSFFAVKGDDSILEAIHSLIKTLEIKDHTTRKHADKIVHYAVKLAHIFGMDNRQAEDVHRAAILHDIGKLGIPDDILLKEGPLTKAEFEIVKQHPKIAGDIMSTAEFLKNSIPYVVHHHEHYDGTGYPAGLRGETIPLGARIISVVDAFEAMTSDGPYHHALSHDDAIEELQVNAGKQFDPEIVKEFVTLLKKEDT